MITLVVILGCGVIYFAIATAVGIVTCYDPFVKETPLEYRIFLWPAAKIWSWMIPDEIHSE